MFLPVNITLQFGDTGDFVAELQRRLSLIKLFNEAFINATYDGNTVNAVKSFQSMQGLRVDGVAGPETLRRLNGVVTGDTSSSSSDNKQEEEQTLQTSLTRDALIMDTMATAIDPTLTAAPAAEEKPAEKPVEKPVVAAPPPRTDMQTNTQELQAQQQQQQLEAIKQQQLQSQQAQPDIQMQQQAQQQQMEALKQQELAKQQQAQQKPPEAQTKPPEPQKPKEELPAERKPLSAMLQKLVDYVESKLPKSVVDEVKNIGQAMLKAGVREAPEAGGAPASPAIEAGRGQQQQAQRGG